MASKPPWRALSVVSLIGIDLAACTVIGYWLGRQADQWLGTEPLGLIIGVLAGLGAGILSIIPVVKKFL
ncbi:AtpZ/AtpI family protein [Caldalkalibacillus thermarum TA2.A1]|uniref:AtpZ/AtpI family protein n=1 Tax=Caldalkalibacillus thermarum (strain TA2.A1) TaxID=986075 RepID=A0A8X8I9K7_CALTT|nr:AtpZ/AtpI family protein [Caldalkalibacillus thermarum]QZT34174.1 AtpZ/AtpI family protein [Caldalkalibacillus thermarum TA2.A1]